MKYYWMGCFYGSFFFVGLAQILDAASFESTMMNLAICSGIAFLMHK